MNKKTKTNNLTTNCCYSQSDHHLPTCLGIKPTFIHLPLNPFPSFLEYTFPLPSSLTFPPRTNPLATPRSSSLVCEGQTRLWSAAAAAAAVPQNSSSAWRQRDCFSSDRRASTSLSGSSPWTLLSLVRTLTLLVIFSFSPTTAKA